MNCICGWKVEDPKEGEGYEDWEVCPNCDTPLPMIPGILKMREELDRIHKERTDLTRMIAMILIDHGGSLSISRSAQLNLDIPNGIIDESINGVTGEIMLRYRVRGEE